MPLGLPRYPMISIHFHFLCSQFKANMEHSEPTNQPWLFIFHLAAPNTTCSLVSITDYIHFYVFITNSCSLCHWNSQGLQMQMYLQGTGHCENTELKKKKQLLDIFVIIKQKEAVQQIELRAVNKLKTCSVLVATGLSTLSALPSSPGKGL